MTLLAVSLLDWVNTGVQVGTLLVFAGTAVAAIVQIRHLRASNELAALLQLGEELASDRMQAALRFVRFDLDEALARPAYREELFELGFVDATAHPEMDACNWFDRVGSLVKHRLIDERTFLDLFARLIIYYWEHCAPAIALLRRRRGAGQYENFEYLAAIARRWKAEHPAGAFPAGVARLEIDDRYREIDAALASARVADVSVADGRIA